MTRRDVDHQALNAGTRRVFELLADGHWHTSAEIEEHCQVTAHSRLADLRGAGYILDKRSNRGETGRRKYSYRLVATAEETAALEQPDALTLSPSVPGCSSATLGADAGTSSTGQPGWADVNTDPPGPPSSDPHDLEDAGWRDMIRDEQLQLGGMRP